MSAFPRDTALSHPHSPARDAMSEFFGIEVAPGEPAYFCPDDTLRSVRLRRATLLMLDDTTEPTRVVVKCRVDRGARLSRFRTRLAFHIACLNLTFFLPSC
jgi:hypothetical protein